MNTTNNRRVLDIGCGYRKTPGSVGMDVLRNSAADVYADLTRAWPFPDRTFDMVVASHVLEHVPDVIHVVEEAYRVLKPAGRFIVRGPHFSSPQLVWGDPTHRRGLSIAMFFYFQPDVAHPYSNAQFRVSRAQLRCAAKPHPGVRERWFRRPVRRALSAYEQFINSSVIQQQRAERLYFRMVPFFEVEVELEAM